MTVKVDWLQQAATICFGWWFWSCWENLEIEKWFLFLIEIKNKMSFIANKESQFKRKETNTIPFSHD